MKETRVGHLMFEVIDQRLIFLVLLFRGSEVLRELLFEYRPFLVNLWDVFLDHFMHTHSQCPCECAFHLVSISSSKEGQSR